MTRSCVLSLHAAGSMMNTLQLFLFLISVELSLGHCQPAIVYLGGHAHCSVYDQSICLSNKCGKPLNLKFIKMS